MNRRFLTYRSFLILNIIVLAVLTFFANNYDYFDFDLVISRYIQTFDGQLFAKLMSLTSTIGNNFWAMIAIFISCVMLAALKRFKEAALIVISSMGIGFVGKIIKVVIERPRPSIELVKRIGEYNQKDSFPSGHVLLAVGLYGFLWFLVFTKMRDRVVLRRVLLFVTGLPLILMGVSRIYLGTHWFSDVLGAYLIGYIWLYLIVHLYRLLDPKLG